MGSSDVASTLSLEEEEEEEGLFKPDAVNEEDPSATATLDIKVLVNYFGEPQGPAKRLRVLIQ